MVGAIAVGTVTGTALLSSITGDPTTGTPPGTAAITVRRITERAITRRRELMRAARQCRMAMERGAPVRPTTPQLALMRAAHPHRMPTDPQAQLKLTIREPEHPRQQCKAQTRTGVPEHRRFRKTAILPTVSTRQMPTGPPGKFTLPTVAQHTVHRGITVTAQLRLKPQMAISTRP